MKRLPPRSGFVRVDFDDRQSDAGREHRNLIAVPGGSPYGSGLVPFRGRDVGALVRVIGTTRCRDSRGPWNIWHCLLVPAVGAFTIVQDEDTGAWFPREDWLAVLLTIRRRVPTHCRGGLSDHHYLAYVRQAFPELARRLDQACVAMGGDPRGLAQPLSDVLVCAATARTAAAAALEASRVRSLADGAAGR